MTSGKTKHSLVKPEDFHPYGGQTGCVSEVYPIVIELFENVLQLSITSVKKIVVTQRFLSKSNS